MKNFPHGLLSAWQNLGTGLTRGGRVRQKLVSHSPLVPSLRKLGARPRSIATCLALLVMSTSTLAGAQAQPAAPPTPAVTKPAAKRPVTARPAPPKPVAAPNDGEEAAADPSAEPAPADATGESRPERPRVEIPPNAAEQAAGLPITAIQIAGNRRVTQDDIRAYLRERVGQPFSPPALTQDVRELYAAGFFDDIEVDLDRTDTGVTLRFLVRERPSVSSIEFDGNEEIDDDALKEGIELKAETVLSQPAVRRSVQKIRDLYAEKGYFLAQVESEVLPQKNNEVRVVFKVKEQQRVSVRRITFIGNDHIPSDELRALMYTGNAGFFAFGSGGPFRQDAFERDIAVISASYYDRGFLSVSINTPRVMLTPDKNGIEVAITIDEGPRFKIRQLRVFERGADGREVEPIDGRRNLRMMVRAETGDYFNRAALLEDLQTIRTLYRDHGYANVDATPVTNVNPQTNEVDVIVPVERGPLVHFERIEVRGNSKTRDRVIRREMEIAEGQEFSESLLERSRRRITALGYFERVDVSTEQGSAPDKMNVYVEVTEKPTGTFQIGAGFSSLENFIATAQVQQANLFGNGQSLSLQAQVSGIRQLVDIRLYEPYFLKSKFSASINLFSQLRVYTDFSQTSTGGSLTFGYPLLEPELTASLTYTGQVDRVSTQAVSTWFGSGTGTATSVFARLPLANLFNDGFTSSIRPGLVYDTRDNRLFPTSGIYLSASTEFATSALGSDNLFLRHRLLGRFYYPLGGGFVLKLNSEAGHVTSPSSDGVPIFARFFLGGIFDVRGFRYRTLGPRVPLTGNTDPNSLPIPNGANIGGNLMYFQNLELEIPVLESVGVRGVLFTDAGNAWNLEQNYCGANPGGQIYPETSPCFDGLKSLARLRTSWGFGIRWFSPLGPLRFEWGYPFKTLPYEEKHVFEFTIGNFF
ncbi:MAG TPA: outer membrane protein assembly factor BamA [Polyangiaceae bacterium]|nr:outer membrane protein assembly factor BamA [Polyangiaceae bacterium]